MRRIVSANETLKGYLHNQRQKAVREMQIAVPGSTDQGMTLAILNSDRIREHSAEWVALTDHYTSEKLPQTSALYDQSIYPLIFWNGQGGLGMIKNEIVQAVTTRIRKVLICLVFQPRKHFIHLLETLREEFLCATNGRRVNPEAKWLLRAEAACLAREDEVKGKGNRDNQFDKFGLRSFIPSSMTHTDQYW
jgi:hypothetical protein